MPKLSGFAIATAILALALSACGSSSSKSPAGRPLSPSASTPSSTSTTGTPGGGTSIAADPGGALKFDKTALTAKAGKVTFQFTNAAQLAHNLTIEKGTKVLGATPTFMASTKSLTVTLRPGKYTFFCSVPGHRQGGMVGTLTVR